MRIVIASEYEKFRPFLTSVPDLFREKRGMTLYEGRNEVRLFMVEGVPLVVKRYKKVNFIQKIVYSFFRLTKAARAFLFAARLRKLGISTPHEVAYMEQWKYGLFEIGYFVSLECKDIPLYDLLNLVPSFDKNLARELAHFIVELHSKGFLHGDMNLNNFLYHKDKKGCHFSVIDTNRSHFCDGWPSRDACLRNFQTLTHRRDLYEYVVGEYAAFRHWEIGSAVDKAFYYLDKFEERHKRKDKFVKCLKRL